MPAHAGHGRRKLQASHASSAIIRKCMARAIVSARATPKRLGTEKRFTDLSYSMSWQAYSTSKPPTHSVTAAHRINMRASSEPAMAIHAAAGDMPRQKPRTRCDHDVNRLV